MHEGRSRCCGPHSWWLVSAPLVGDADVLPRRYSTSIPASANSAWNPVARERNPGRVRECAKLAVGGDEVGIRRQDRPVDHRLGGGERGAVERCEPGDDGVDEGIQLGVGQGAGDPAPSFGGGCVVVGAGEDDLQCAVTTDGARKQLRAATTGQQATADLGLPEDRLLTAGVAQVECEREVTAAPGAASDGCDGDVGALQNFRTRLVQTGTARLRGRGVGGMGRSSAIPGSAGG